MLTRPILLAITLLLSLFCPLVPAEDQTCPLDFIPSGYADSSRSNSQDVTAAVVRVRAGSRLGSGVLIWNEGSRGIVLTAAHVVERDRQVEVLWHDQRGSTAQVLLADTHYDIAVLSTTAPRAAVVVPIAGEQGWPRQGDRVRLLGYGGGRFRDWTATVNGYAKTGGRGLNQTLSVDTQTIGGDSGGPILFNQRVVAIIWGGPLAGPGGPMLATHGTSSVAIRGLLKKVAPQTLTSPFHQSPLAQQGCPPGSINCPIRPSFPPTARCPIQPPQVDPELSELKRQLRLLQTEIARLKNQPPSQPPAIDFDRLIDSLIDELSSDPRFRGPPGKPGPAGRDGSDGQDGNPPDVDALANQIRQRLAGSLRIRVQPVSRRP